MNRTMTDAASVLDRPANAEAEERERVDLGWRLAWSSPVDFSTCTIAEFRAIALDVHEQLVHGKHATQGCFGHVRKERRINAQNRACWRWVVYTELRGNIRERREESAYDSKRAALTDMRRWIGKRWGQVALASLLARTRGWSKRVPVCAHPCETCPFVSDALRVAIADVEAVAGMPLERFVLEHGFLCHNTYDLAQIDRAWQCAGAYAWARARSSLVHAPAHAAELVPRCGAASGTCTAVPERITCPSCRDSFESRSSIQTPTPEPPP